MNRKFYEKGSRDEKLWITLVALLFGLGIIWVAGI
jgi:hypothetical protein